MTKFELERRVAELEAKGGDDAPHRIQTLRDHYERQQAQQAAEREKEQQQAEAAMKQRARDAFMKNPASTTEAFEKSWEGIKLRILSDEAISGERAARAQQGAATREAF